MGFVFQSYHLLDDLTVYENLEIPLSYRDMPKKDRDGVVCDLLDRFHFVAKKDLYPSQLSGGQQQLVGVARALVARPALILADEPTGNLHSDQGREIMQVFKELNEKDGVTIIQVTHSKENAGFGSRIVRIADGISRTDYPVLRSGESMLSDLQYAFRSLRKSPGFTAIVLLTLGLGIGATTALFSVVNAVLLQPLAYKDPEQLVTLLHRGVVPVSIANYLDWQEQTRSFSAMGAAESWSPNLTGTTEPENLVGLRVTQSMLPVLGVRPEMGRMFAAGADRTGAELETVISHSLWERRFGSDPGVLGRASCSTARRTPSLASCRRPLSSPLSGSRRPNCGRHWSLVSALTIGLARVCVSSRG